jgi:RNA polymerase sigma-54 factor
MPVMESRPDDPMVDVLPGHAEEAPLDLDYENTFTNNGAVDDSGELGGDFGNRGGRHDFSDDGDFEQSLTREESLRDHLMSQLNLDFTDSGDRLIGIYLIEMLDEAGYLSGDLDALAQSLGCDLARVESVLARLQRFDPPGLFARSLSECLALQLRERDRLDPCMQALLDNLELLGRRDLAGLMKICGADAEDLAHRRDPCAGPQAGAGLRPSRRPAGYPRRADAPGRRRRLAGRTQQRHPSARAGEYPLLRQDFRRLAQ